MGPSHLLARLETVTNGSMTHCTEDLLPKKKPALREGRLFPPMLGSEHGLAHLFDALNGGNGPPLGILSPFRMEGGSLLPRQRAHGGPRNAR